MNTRLLTVLGLLLLLALSACGFIGNDDDPTPTPDEPTAATDAATPTNADDPTSTIDGGSTTATAMPADSGGAVRMARANWSTGWFQAEVYAQLLEELGYEVDSPGDSETLAPADFYPALNAGDYHMWVNGWFPLHTSNVAGQESIQLLGSEVRGGARQGYLIDKSTALAASITNLEDLQDPEKAAFFDNDGDGKADLIGCNEGWGCEAVIEHHLDAYGLRDTVTHVQDNYDDLMRTTVDRYENGEPVLFYTWTPNWPIDQLQPGEDVLWLEVPFSSLPPGQEDQEAFTLVPDVEGCASNPCNLGYPLNDIRVAANSAFLEANPSARRLLQLVQIPLADIAEQNSEMFQGATSQEDIQRHAANWIIDNRDQVDDWLADAADWQPMPTLQRVRERGVLRCGIQDDLRGFGYREGATYTGFNADFCRVVATAVFGNAQAVEFVPVNVRERFAYVDDGRIDVLFHNATWLASRDTGMDPPNSGIRLELGPTIFHDGQRFMVSAASGIEQLDDLEGRTICVLADSTAESTLNEQLGAQGIGFDIERLSEQQLYDVYERGGCDAVTAATSELVARRAAFLSPETHTVLDQPISREPLSPAYAEGDSAWADIIRWSIYATIYAEEQQVDMDNVATALNQGDPDIERLLGERGFIGERLGLENEFAYQIIEQVGNYRDIYNRHVGPETPLDLPRGPNKTWNSPEGPGGVLSAPPFR